MAGGCNVFYQSIYCKHLPLAFSKLPMAKILIPLPHVESTKKP